VFNNTSAASASSFRNVETQIIGAASDASAAINSIWSSPPSSVAFCIIPAISLAEGGNTWLRTTGKAARSKDQYMSWSSHLRTVSLTLCMYHGQMTRDNLWYAMRWLGDVIVLSIYIPSTVVAGEAVSGARMWGVRIYNVWLNYKKVRFVTLHTCSYISYCLVYSRETMDVKYYSRSGEISTPITIADWQLRDIVMSFFTKVDSGQPIKI
jgi:hypothetical protein